jgi:hypothetical protein
MTDIFEMAAQASTSPTTQMSTSGRAVFRRMSPASSCLRSPRSRLSPRAIVGRPESRQGDLHLAALPLHLEACPRISMTIGGFCLWTSRATC